MELLISARALESGELASACHELAGAVALGRGPESPLPLDGTGISREHFRLHSEGGRIFITDLSSNGTWLNERRLKRGEPHAITPSDTIKIPGFEIGIQWPAASAPPDAAAGPARGPLALVRSFAASFSIGEKLLVALAMATLALVAAYFSA